MIGKLVSTTSDGSGNSQCQIPKHNRITLNNEYVYNWNYKKFIEYIKTKYEVNNLIVILSKRKTKSRLGTAWLQRQKIVIYRHSIWVLLHEIAHIVSYKLNNNLGTGHGKFFGNVLTEITKEWATVCERNEHLPEVILFHEYIKPIKPIKEFIVSYKPMTGRKVYLVNYSNAKFTTDRNRAWSCKRQKTAEKYIYKLRDVKQKFIIESILK